MAGEVSGVDFGKYTINSNKPVSDFEKTGDVIDDEIISFVQENNSDLISKLGLDTENFTVDDLNNAINSNENSELQEEISTLQQTLSDSLYELISGDNQLYSDENIQNADFEDARETAVNYFSMFNKDYDKAVEVQSFISDAISEYNNETKNEQTQETSSSDFFDNVINNKIYNNSTEQTNETENSSEVLNEAKITYKDGKRTDYTQDLGNGQKLYQSVDNEGNAISSPYVDTFDDEGNISERVMYDANGTKTAKYSYEGSELGKPTSIERYDSEGNVTESESRKYNDDGSTTHSIKYFNADGSTSSTKLYTEGWKKSSVDDTATSETEQISKTDFSFDPSTIYEKTDTNKIIEEFGKEYFQKL